MLDQTKLYNYKFIQNLYKITHTNNLSKITKALDLPNQGLNPLINNSQIGNVNKLCKTLNISADYLFNYAKTHSLNDIDNDIIWHQIQKYNQIHHLTMQQLNTKVDFDLVKFNREMPIPLIYKLAHHYQISLNTLFKVDKPKLIPQTDLTGQSVFNNLKMIMEVRHQTINQYTNLHHLPYTAFSNMQNNNTTVKLYQAAQYFKTTVDKLLTYQVPSKNQNIEFIQSLKHAPFHTFVQDQLKKQNSNDINQFLSSLRFNNNTLEKSSHTQTTMALFLIAQDSGLNIHDIISGNFNLKQIKPDEMHNHKTVKTTAKLETKLTPSNQKITKLPPESVLEEQKAKEKPMVESVDELFDDEPTKSNKNINENESDSINHPQSSSELNNNNSSDPNSRLNRLFEQIKHLDQNQILILNDLVKSWQK